MTAMETFQTANEIQAFIGLLNGKWKLPIIHELVSGPKRFGELRRSLGGITQKVLTDALRTLEEDGLIERNVYPDTILHVEYQLSHMGWLVYPILNQMTLCMHEYGVYMSERRTAEERKAPFFRTERGARIEEPLETRISNAREALQEAECFFIGTGSGLNAAYGVNLFSRLLAKVIFRDAYRFESVEDLINRFSDIIPGNEESFWRFWSSFIWYMRFEREVNEGHQMLADFAKTREYFAATTNADCQLLRAGLSPERVFMGLGNYSYLQCITPCRNRVFDAKPYMEHLRARLKEGSFTDQDIPRCPFCGSYLVPNHFRTRAISVASANTSASQEDVLAFVRRAQGRKIVYLEIGCGRRMPNIVRNQVEKYVISNTNATMIRLNPSDCSFLYPEAEMRAILFEEDIQTVLPAILLPGRN